MFYHNIHTHHKTEGNTIAIQNLFPNQINQIIDGSYYSCGIHPWFLKKEDLQKELGIIESVAKQNKIIAIGECGLDKHCAAEIDLQLKVFKSQIEISEHFRLPVIIHCVKSYNEIIHLRKEVNAKQPWIIHGFAGKLQLAEQLINHEFLLSFGEVVLKKNPTLSNTIQNIPDKSFFLETDDKNVSIDQIYYRLAEIRNTTIEHLQWVQIENFKNTFQIVNGTL